MVNRLINDISDYIFVSDMPVKADAIFLPGGSHPEQPEYAAQLYLNGFAKWLVPAGGVSAKTGKFPGVRSKNSIYCGDYRSECDFFTDVLNKNGVPASAIIGENLSGHTRDNAFFSRRKMDETGITVRSALIVCKAFHARRCLMFYQMAFPDTLLKICPVSCYNITKNNWFQSETGIDRVMGELSRCGAQTAADLKKIML